MADVHDKKTRSFNISQIKSKNTKPEILVRKFLFSKGLIFKARGVRNLTPTESGEARLKVLFIVLL
jgi:G:T-mismatch repair DNA endonuclease (very short patch repair protein)